MTDLNTAVSLFLESVRERIPDPEEFAAYCDVLHRDMARGLVRGKEPPRLMTTGRHIRIRTACLDDEPFMRMVEREDDNQRWVGHWPLPWRIARFGDPDFLQCIIERGDGSPVGILIFCGLTHAEEKLQLKRIALMEKGQGLGREALALAQKWAFEVVGTPTLFLGTKAENHRAQHVYLSTGFHAGTPLPCTFFYRHREDYEADNA